MTTNAAELEPVKTEIQDYKAILTPPWNLDTEETADALKAAVMKAASYGVSVIVVDFSSVQNINSLGLGRMVLCYKTLKERKVEIRVCGLSGFVKDTFDLVMMHELFPIDGEH